MSCPSVAVVLTEAICPIMKTIAETLECEAFSVGYNPAYGFSVFIHEGGRAYAGADQDVRRAIMNAIDKRAQSS